MTRHTKKLIILGGLGVAGFVLWRQFSSRAENLIPSNFFAMPQTAGIEDAMAIIDDMLLNNPFKRPAGEVVGINPDAPKIYL